MLEVVDRLCRRIRGNGEPEALARMGHEDGGDLSAVGTSLKGRAATRGAEVDGLGAQVLFGLVRPGRQHPVHVGALVGERLLEPALVFDDEAEHAVRRIVDVERFERPLGLGGACGASGQGESGNRRDRGAKAAGT